MNLRSSSEPPRLDDAVGASALIYETMGTLGDFLFGQPGREDSSAVVGSAVSPSRPICFPMKIRRWRSRSGRIVGIAQAFPGADLWKAALGLMRVVHPAPGICGLPWPSPGAGCPWRFEPVADADEYYVQTLAVAPAFRNRGIGRALLQNAQRQTAARGFPVCSLDVMLQNTDALRFYQREGFTIARKVVSRLRAPGVQYAGFYRMRKRGNSNSSRSGDATAR